MSGDLICPESFLDVSNANQAKDPDLLRPDHAGAMVPTQLPRVPFSSTGLLSELSHQGRTTLPPSSMDLEPDLGVRSLTFAKLALAEPKMCHCISSSIFHPPSRVHVVWPRGQFTSDTAGAAAD
jgi:hypothetical protein